MKTGERIPPLKRGERLDRMEPAWYELADKEAGLKLKARQDARSEAWREGREAEPAHPEEYEGVLLVGGKRYSVWGRYEVEPGDAGSSHLKTAAERARDYRKRRKARKKAMENGK